MKCLDMIKLHTKFSRDKFIGLIKCHTSGFHSCITLLMEPTVACIAPHSVWCRYSPFSSRNWRPLKLGCSKNTQDPARTLQD